MFLIKSNLSTLYYRAGKTWRDVERFLWSIEGPEEETFTVHWID